MTLEHSASGVGRVGSLAWVPRPGLRAVLAAAGVIAAVAATLAVSDSATWNTSHAAAGPEAAIGDLAAGLGLIAAGSLVSGQRRFHRLGLLLVLLGAAWLAADFVGWQGASPQLRVLSWAGSILLVPLLLDVVASAPAGGPAPSRLRSMAIGAYVVSASLAGLLVLSRDPLSDTACWDFCGANPFLFASLTGLEPGLAAMVTALSAFGGAAIAITSAARLVGATAPARRDLAPVLLPALLAGTLLAGRAVLFAGRHAPGPSDPSSLALHQALAWVLVVLAAGVILVARRHHRVRVALAELAFTASDGSSRRSAAAALTAATGDTSLRVAYPLADERGMVDAHGFHVEATPRAGRARTTVTRAGATIAVIEHDPDVIDPAELAEQIGPALRLSLENDRLDAELWVRLREVRMSRARIVAAGDRERVRREHALHDGAQQRLLALTYDLRAARDAAAAEAGATVTDHLDAAVEAVHSAHDELRELAHGIYPAVLGEAGLQPALEGLAERARVPVRLDADGADRCDESAEMTAYVVAEALIHDAGAREATRVSLRLAREDASLVLTVEDDGRAPEVPIVHGVDRAGAAGGQLMLSGRDGLVLHRLEVPCASS